MEREDLIGKNSSKGLSEDVNGEYYTVWEPDSIVQSTVSAVCDWLRTRSMQYMKCDGVTESYEFDTDKFSADLKRAVDAALNSAKTA